MSRGKTGSQAQVPPGTANTVQGVAVLGYAHGDAAGHPTVTWVTR